MKKFYTTILATKIYCNQGRLLQCQLVLPSPLLQCRCRIFCTQLFSVLTFQRATSSRPRSWREAISSVLGWQCQSGSLKILTSRSKEVMKMTEGILEYKPTVGKSSSLFVRGTMPLKPLHQEAERLWRWQKASWSASPLQASHPACLSGVQCPWNLDLR